MRRKSSSRRHRGGSNNSGIMPAPNPSSYSSASTYGEAVNGSVDSQYSRVFDQKGPDASFQSNSSIGVQGQRAGKRSRSRGKRGGLWGHVVNQAIVPFSILAAQQTYKPRSKQGGRRTRRKKSVKRSRRHR